VAVAGLDSSSGKGIDLQIDGLGRNVGQALLALTDPEFSRYSVVWLVRKQKELEKRRPEEDPLSGDELQEQAHIPIRDLNFPMRILNALLNEPVVLLGDLPAFGVGPRPLGRGI
jgi:hypothetical protein